jgi:hypothetical protein
MKVRKVSNASHCKASCCGGRYADKWIINTTAVYYPTKTTKGKAVILAISVFHSLNYSYLTCDRAETLSAPSFRLFTQRFSTLNDKIVQMVSK